MPASGGECGSVVEVARDGNRMLRPYFLSDGKHYIATGDLQVWLGELGRDSLSSLREMNRAEAVVAPGDLLIVKGPDGMLAHPVDIGRKRLGEPRRILPLASHPGGHTSLSFAEGVMIFGELSGTARQPAAGLPRALGMATRGSNALELRPIPSGVWSSLRAAHDGRRILLSGWNVRVMDWASGEWRRVAGSAEAGREPNSQLLWSTGDTAIVFLHQVVPPEIRMVSMSTGAVRTLRALPYDGVPAPFSVNVDWSPDGKRLATGADDRTVRLWDAQSGEEQLALRLHADVIAGVCWSPDGRRVGSGSWDRTAKVWDAQTGEMVRDLRGHFGQVPGVAWSPDGRRLATGSSDGTVRVWDTVDEPREK